MSPTRTSRMTSKSTSKIPTTPALSTAGIGTASIASASIGAAQAGFFKNLVTANTAMGGSLSWISKLESTASGLMTSFKVLGKGAVATAIITNLVGAAFKGLLAIIGSVITSIGGMIASSIKFTMQFLDGENKLSAFINGLAEFTSNIPIIGGVLGGLIGIVGSVVKHLEDLSDTQANLSSSGASFNQNLMLLKQSANRAGGTLEQFANVVRSNTENFANFGTVTTGALKFAAASKILREEFRNMGYTTEAFNDELASAMGILGTGAAVRGDSDAVTAKAAKGLMIEFDLMAKLTGKSRKSQEEIAKRQLLDAAYQRKLATMSAEEQSRTVEALTRTTATLGEGGADVFKANLLGMSSALTTAGRMFTVTMPDAARSVSNLSKNIYNASESQIDFTKRLDSQQADALDKALRAGNKFDAQLIAGALGISGTAAELNKIFTEIYQSGKGFLNADKTLNKEAFMTAIQKARDEQHGRERIVSSLKRFEEMVMNLRDSVITKILVPMLEKFTPMLEKFVNWIASNQDFLIKKITEFGTYIIKVASDIGTALMTISSDDIQNRMIDMLSYVGEVVVLNIMKMLGVYSQDEYNTKLEAVNLQKSLNDAAKKSEILQIDKIKSQQELNNLSKQQQYAMSDGIRLANEKLIADKAVIDAQNKLSEASPEDKAAKQAILSAAEASQKASNEAFDKVKQFVTFDKNTKTNEVTAKLDTKAFEKSTEETGKLITHIQELNNTLKEKGPVQKQIEKYKSQNSWAEEQQRKIKFASPAEYQNVMNEVRKSSGSRYNGLGNDAVSVQLRRDVEYNQKKIEDLQKRQGTSTDSEKQTAFENAQEQKNKISRTIRSKDESISRAEKQTLSEWRVAVAKHAHDSAEDKQNIINKEKESVKKLQAELVLVTKTFETLRKELNAPLVPGATETTPSKAATGVNTGSKRQDVAERFKQVNELVGHNNSIRGYQAVAGGTIDQNLINIAKLLPKGLGQFSAFNDEFHQRKGHEGSKHRLGKAFDFVVNKDEELSEFKEFKSIDGNGNKSWIDFLKSEQGDKWIQQKLRGASGGIPVKILNEYAHPSKGETGGHMHLELERETGSIGKTSKLFENFGAGTPLTAHGLESIVTPDQMKFLFTDVQTRTAKNFTTILTDLLKTKTSKSEESVPKSTEVPVVIPQKPVEDKSSMKIVEAFNNGVNELSSILDEIKEAIELSNRNLGKVVKNTV